MNATLAAVWVVFFVAVFAAIVAYYFLGKFGPRWAVLALAIFLYFASFAIQPGDQRELHLLVGILRFSGFIGMIFGLFELFRRRVPPNGNEDGSP